ncbi:MAG: DUF1080 domain-containing protein [Fimbriimonadia bacterium]|nr:DUF1080 domain-containing protein [Fimbriimonadia bacterium]
MKLAVATLTALFLTFSAPWLAQEKEPEFGRTKDIPLFNEQDLSGWDFFLADQKVKMNEVWGVGHDTSSGGHDHILVCKGQPAGYIYTIKKYKNFILKLQWRWAPGKQPSNSGVLLRVQEPHKVWPKSIEAQLAYKNAGDFWLIDGAKLETDPARVNPNSSNNRYRSNKTAEKDAPAWNEYEIYVNGDKVRLKINGEVVNEGTGAEAVAGHIALQSEGGEIHFRNIRLMPLPD